MTTTTLKTFLAPVYASAASFGINPRQMLLAAAGLPRFVSDCARYARRQRREVSGPFRLSWRYLCPIVSDYRGAAGVASGHYFHQDLWAARKIFARRPARHVDVGSRIDGFVAHLLVFMPVEVVDIRPLAASVEGLVFRQDDAARLEAFADASVESLSSLHAAEHFGLGRYSDRVDPGAHRRFMSGLERVLAPGGRFYFSVPIGAERVEFNAHRVFGVETILGQFAALELVSFSYVDDAGVLHEPSAPSEAPASLRFGCGLFEFTKP